MILECPNCQTRYETSALLPPEGRKVRCARCSNVWHAMPAIEEPEPEIENTDDTSQDNGIPPINPGAEGGQDLEFRDSDQNQWDQGWAEAQSNSQPEEEATDFDMNWGGSVEPDPEPEPVSAPASFQSFEDSFQPAEPHRTETLKQASNPVEIDSPVFENDQKIEIDPGYLKKKRFSNLKAMMRNQSELRKAIAGWGGLAVLVVVCLLSAYFFRISIVSALPGAAHLYSLAGIDVNVRGLAFEKVAYQDGTEAGQPVIQVSGKIVNVTDRTVSVPTLVFAFRDREKAELYHWTKRIDTKSLTAGQVIDFQFNLPNPPKEAASIEVRFARKTTEF